MPVFFDAHKRRPIVDAAWLANGNLATITYYIEELDDTLTVYSGEYDGELDEYIDWEAKI